jgi:AbrB family looped-hinge helix DNA binding protein
MLQTPTITQKGQVTIPAEIRRELGLLPRQRVIIIKEADGAKIKPLKDFFSLFGSVKPKSRPENFKAMRKKFVQYLSKRKQHG